MAQISVKDMKPIRQVKAKRPKHRVTSRVTALLKAGARSQLGAGGQEPRELVHLEPGVGAVGEPHPAHNHHEPGEGADDDGVQEHPRAWTQPWSQGCPGVGGGGGHGDGALARLVGHEAPLDALAQRHPEGPPEHRLRRKAWPKTAPKNQGIRPMLHTTSTTTVTT